MVLRRLPYLLGRTLHGLASRRSVFTYIYHRQGWSKGESCSGAASTLARAAAVREALPGLIRDTDTRVLLDIPCGDCHWIRHVELELERYIGADIVEPLIEANRRRWGGPGREFLVLDLVEDPLPPADLVLCRDCLVHLRLRDGVRALANIRKSGARYLLATTFPGTHNRPIITGQWRPVDLTRSPFDLPRPERLIDERFPGYPQRSLGLWRL